jgi:hypothetical protein
LFTSSNVGLAASIAVVLGAAALLLPMSVRATCVRFGQRPSLAASKIPDTAIRLKDLQDRLVDPFQPPIGTKAIVFVFVRVDCPASNRYTPDLRGLYDRFAGRGVRFWLVYPDVQPLSVVRDHAQGLKQTIDALRDPQHLLVKRIGVLVTPEAAVFDPGGRLLYHGRIDDRYVAYGIERPSPMSLDLHDALVAVLAGRRVPHAVVKAVGCQLSDVAE